MPAKTLKRWRRTSLSRHGKSRTPFSSSGKKVSLDLPPFLLDENVGGKELSEALRKLGLTVHLSRDLFGKGVADEVLLDKAGECGWILLTKDRRIRRRPVELAALKRARVRTLFFAAGDMTSTQMIHSLRAALPRIQRLVKRQKPPFLRRITPKGLLEKL